MQLCSSAEGGLAAPSVLPQATCLGAYKRKSFFAYARRLKTAHWSVECWSLEQTASLAG